MSGHPFDQNNGNSEIRNCGCFPPLDAKLNTIIRLSKQFFMITNHFLGISSDNLHCLFSTVIN
jgi:hypothetical protein